MESDWHPSKREHLEAFGRYVDRLSTRLVRVTVPIYRVGVRGQPECFGSGVLIRIGDLGFLLTAAHVVDTGERGEIYYGVEGRILPTPSLVFKTNAPQGDRDNDLVDLAFWVLEPGVLRSLPSADYLVVDELLLEQDLHLALPPKTDFLVVGYPFTRQPRAVVSDEFSARAMRFITQSLPEDAYQAAGKRIEDSLLVEYNKQSAFSPEGRVTGPDLEGVSGSGIWYPRGLLKGEARDAKLAAIAIRWRLADPKAIVGTPLAAFGAAVAVQFPNLQRHLPQPWSE